MPRPIVHIGYHKTATTWFQKAVYPRVRNLQYVDRIRVNRALLAASALHFDPAWSREQLDLALNSTPLLCEEALSGHLMSGGLRGYQSAETALRIHELFPDARIVVFVRAQPEMIAATYQEYVRVGGTHPPRRFLWPEDFDRAGSSFVNPAARFSFDHFEYDRLLAHYARLFGAENVHAYAYESLVLEGRDFLARFARELALDLDLDSVPMQPRNVAYTLAANRLARVLNRFTAHTVADKHHWLHVPRWYGTRKRLVERLSASGLLGGRVTPERLLGDGTVAWIRQRYWESNRRLAALTGLDLATLGYPLEPPREPVPRPAPPLSQRWLSR